MKKNRVEIEDSFWSSRIRQMCETIIPYQYAVLNDQIPGIPRSHAIENFRIAAGLSEGMYQGMLFQDSDVGKWIEAAAWSLGIRGNPEIEEKIDGLTEILKKAQQEDGYLNSYYTCVRPGERLTNIAHGHEMYCAGHLVEAAVAYAQVSGKTELLDIMEDCIEYFMSKIGPEKEKLHIYPGHPELELALYKLYRYTKKDKYLEFMKYLLLERGKQPSFLPQDPGFGEQYHDKWFGLEYHQAHLPVLEQREAKGHAVRAMYLYAGLADLAYETKDPEITEALETLWEDVTERKMYVTGAVGAEEHGEAFGVPYDLPNDRGYAETCASIGLIFWARRMLKLRLDSRYADVMELALYNGALSGMSLDGMSYFYVNPLMVIPDQAENRYDLRHVRTERVSWFGCACCPPNAARLLMSLPDYICDYEDYKKELTVHLYICGKISISENIWFEVSGDYIESGKVKFRYCGNPEEMTLRLRLPGWSRKIGMRMNGSPYHPETESGYARITKRWTPGDELELTFEVTPCFIYADPRVAADAGRAAVRRGPVIYCLEQEDNGKNLNSVVVKGFCSAEDCMEQQNNSPEDNKHHSWNSPDGDGRNDVFPGNSNAMPVHTVYLYGYREKTGSPEGKLYSVRKPVKEKSIFKAVPYHIWGNRGKGEMLVWIRKGE
ncbi:MAG TPA: glycoside hydrolase family 127 protein [Candidatus Mediterraneibacter norwichensis]|nr:glycoside hydrolase family 127 protein [Candidatus Mediterraneibacter norwichensis]